MNLFGWENILDKETVTLAQELLDTTDSMRTDKNIYPDSSDVFRALELVDPNNIKVVILGQDPYHGKGQATGLSFSVQPQCKLPASLRNIYKEYESDLGRNAPETGDLTAWAKQGVLMLNTTLTVEESKPNSHRKLGWNKVTHSILTHALKQDKPGCHVVLAWGMNAINEVDSVLEELSKTERERVYVLRSTHPSPFSAKNTKTQYHSFMGSQPFSSTNNILRENNLNEIDW